MRNGLRMIVFLVMASLLFAGNQFSEKQTAKTVATGKSGTTTWVSESGPFGHLPRVGTRNPVTLDEVIISEDFEAVAAGQRPAGWTYVDVDQGSTTDPACPGQSIWRVFDQTGFPAHSGTRIMANHYNDGALPNNDWLILPQQNLTGTITLSYWIATHQASYPESYELRVSTTGTQPANFTHVIYTGTNISSTYTLHTHDLSEFAGAPFYIAFRYTSIDMFVIKLDDVLLEAGDPGPIGSIACTVTNANTSLPVEDVAVTVETTAFEGTTNAAGYLLFENVPAGTYTLNFSHPDYISATSTNVSVTEGDTTELAIQLTPLSGELVIDEDFEGVAVGQRPAGWTYVDVDQGSTTDPACAGLSVWRVFEQTGFPAHSGTKIMANHYNDGALPNNDWLILPQQLLHGSISLNYWIATHQASYPESYEVRVSTSGTLPANFTHLIYTGTDIPAEYTEHTHDLSEFADAPFYVAFHYISVDEFVIKLDDVKLRGEPDAADDISIVPTTFAFHGNYPNPFNAQTRFHFDLEKTGSVQLVLYNVVGQEVARLVDGTMNAGAHSVAFDAAELPSGLYLARLTAGENSAVHKMMLLK